MEQPTTTKSKEQELRQMAANLLMAIWRGIPAGYKQQYARNIWEQFENQVRSAAYTNSLAKFVNSLSLKFQATIGVTPEEREQAERILNSGQDRALLKIMREQTTILVLMLRVENQARRKEWEEEWEMEHAEPAAAGGYAKLDLFSSTED